MAATEREADAGVATAKRAQGSALLAAALALPGVLPALASAQDAPDHGLVALKYLDYRDWQAGADRMRVRSPSFYVLAPVTDTLAAEGSLVYDSVSGASPLFHNTLSGASGTGITDYRTAGDAKLTKYFDGVAVGLGAAVSSERDYFSRALSFDLRVASEDRNRTFAFGVGGASDRINSTNGRAAGRQRHTLDLLLGVTHTLSTDAIVQSSLTYSDGHGYYSDPYKALDIRPDHRRIFAWLTRYNQHLPWQDATLKLSYRFLDDSFGDDSHTVEIGWHQPLSAGWSVTPSLRYYTQSAASFYFDPPFPQGFVPGTAYTADTRLSAFGALTPGITVSKLLPEGWSIDLKLEYYRQRAAWRLGGGGSPGLETFSARWIEAGIAKTF